MSETVNSGARTIALVGVGGAAAFGATFWGLSSMLSTPLPTPLHPLQTATGSTPHTVRPVDSMVRTVEVYGPPSELFRARLSAGSEAIQQRSQSAMDIQQTAPMQAARVETVLPGLMPGTLFFGNGSPKESSVTPLPAAKVNAAAPNLSPPASMKPLELVGTMLGDRPSAVFRGESRLITVPVGGAYDGWTVVSVDHGEAVVQYHRDMVRLRLGEMSPTGGNDRIATPETTAPAMFASSASSHTDSTLPRDAGSQDRDTMRVSGVFAGNAPIAEQPSTSPRTSGELAQQDNALPMLPDTRLTPDGKVARLPDDTAIRDDSAALAPSTAPHASQPAFGADLKPFRRLVAVDGDPNSAPALTRQATLESVSTGAPIAARMHVIHRHRHHRSIRRHRRHHGHRRYFHRRPMHQKLHAS
jgi:hypothetical protein